MANELNPLLTNLQVNPTQENEDGSMTFDLTDRDLMSAEDILNEAGNIEVELESEFYDNLVSLFDEEALTDIAEKVIDAVEADETSREEWMRTLEDGLDLLGIGIEQVSEPFEGACSASHPLILEAAIKFQSKASQELLPASGPVKTQILGNASREKEEKADRVKEFMNWQATTQMTEYYPDTERMLFYVPIIGSGFKKAYWCEEEARPVSELIPVDQFVVPYSCTDLERARRYTHILYKTKDELAADVMNGLYDEDAFDKLNEPRKIELSSFQTKQSQIIGLIPGETDFDKVYTLYEQHVYMFFKEDKIDKEQISYKFNLAKPYIITVDKDSGTVLGIRRNWKEGDVKFRKKTMFIHYSFVPGVGFYGLGYVHLLGNLQMTLTSSLRALVDAGQFANLPAGFISKAIRQPKDEGPLRPGEFRPIELAGQKISEAFIPLPYKEPSQTLFALMQFLDGRGLQFADAESQVVGDSTNYGPVGTTMALLDASTRFFSAAHKRLHFAQKKELQLLFEINSEYLEDLMEYNLPGNTLKISRSDFDGNILDVIPVSDPNIPSNAHRIAKEMGKVQAVQQLGAMGQVNMKEMLRRIFLSFGEKDIDKLVPPDEEVKPNDPLTDILEATQGKPIKAFPGQNHDAHIQTKSLWLQSPMGGLNEAMQQYVPNIQANITEHTALAYSEQMQALGAQSGNDFAVAQAAQQLAQVQQQMQIQGQQDTPEGKIAEAELIKAQVAQLEFDHKKKKDFASMALEAEQLNLEQIKEANRHTEAQNTVMAGLTKERMKQGKDLTLAAVNNLAKENQVKTKNKE